MWAHISRSVSLIIQYNLTRRGINLFVFDENKNQFIADALHIMRNINSV